MVSSVACDVTSQILMLLSNETEATFWLSGSKQQAVSDIMWGSEAQGKWLDTAPSALWATRPWDTEVAPPRQRQCNRNTTLVFTRKGLFTCIITSWMPAVYQAVNQELCPLPPQRSQADTAEQATTCSKCHRSKPTKGNLAQPREVAKSYGGKQERKRALGRRNRVCRGLTWGHIVKEHVCRQGLECEGREGMRSHMKGKMHVVWQDTPHGSRVIKINVRRLWKVVLGVCLHVHTLTGRPPSSVLLVIGTSPDEPICRAGTETLT